MHDSQLLSAFACSSFAQNTTILAGIYLHIPFCKQACTYCNFHFTTSLRYKDGLVKAISREASMEAAYLSGEKIKTIYFGGGTPSILHTSELELLLDSLQKGYKIEEDVEVTLEANPDDINEEKLTAWKAVGINRLSIGTQSFFDEELKWMNRAHNAIEAKKNLELARKHFDNITIDLIYGSPLLTDEMWRSNVQEALQMEIPHLSCYALTVEEKTKLQKQIDNHQSPDVDPDKQARQFLLLMQWLREKGYEHYEVSNFAKPGFRSRHNSSYWKGEPYLGLGPSAHSYNGTERRWNIANNNVYLKGINEDRPDRETEILTRSQKLNEYVMISLRTMEGLNLDFVATNWGEDERQRLERDAQKFIEQKLVNDVNNTLKLTDEGMLMADGIAASLFVS